MAGFDATILHVEVLAAPPIPGPRRRQIGLAPDKYRRLAAYMMTSSAADSLGTTMIVPHAHYGDHDAFFEARGRYSLVVTCNEWTRRALAEAGVRVPVWSPLDTALFYQSPRTAE